LSFVLVFAITLAFRIVTGRGAGGAGAGLILDDPASARATVVTDVRPNEAPSQIGSLLVHNGGRAAITLTRASLLRVDPGLGVAGFAVLYPAENDTQLGGQCGPFPPPNFATHPFGSETRLGAGEHAAIVVAVRATREGEFSLDGVRISYVAGGKRYHQDLPLRVTLRTPNQRGSTGQS
jgi:hypothetical protein